MNTETLTEEKLQVGDVVLITDLYNGLQTAKVVRTTKTWAILDKKDGICDSVGIKINIEGGREIPSYSNKHSRHIHTYHKYSIEKEKELLKHYKYIKGFISPKIEMIRYSHCELITVLKEISDCFRGVNIDNFRELAPTQKRALKLIDPAIIKAWKLI